MRKIRQVLRLAWEGGLGQRQIARSLSISPTTVGEYLRRASVGGLSWPLSGALDDAQLEALLFPLLPKEIADERPLPDWAEVHQELKRKGVTLQLLWHEYKAAHPEGLQYSQFCDRYQEFAGKLDLVMRQHHRGGEKLFVDYAGQGMPIVERATGEVHEAEIFVATMGASNYTYAEGTWTQGLADWCGSHIRTFEFLGAVPALLVPGNLRSERWILARLRHQSFFSLAELNAAIRELLEELNRRPFKKLPGCRRTLFEQLDRPAMKPLPRERYSYAEWKRARVHIDYHAEVEGHYYSAPYQLVKQELEVRLSAHTVECFYKGKGVASRRRSYHKGRHTTLPEHMPKAHQHYAGWSPQRLVGWAEKTGPATAELVASILTARAHPQQGYRSCLGIMRLGKHYGESRLEAASRRALAIGAVSFKSLESILKHGLEAEPLPNTETPAAEPLVHPNLRGADYYH